MLSLGWELLKNQCWVRLHATDHAHQRTQMACLQRAGHVVEGKEFSIPPTKCKGPHQGAPQAPKAPRKHEICIIRSQLLLARRVQLASSRITSTPCCCCGALLLPLWSQNATKKQQHGAKASHPPSRVMEASLERPSGCLPLSPTPFCKQTRLLNSFLLPLAATFFPACLLAMQLSNCR